MKFHIIFYLFVFNGDQLIPQNLASPHTKNDYDQCESFLKGISHYWRKDSIGSNGLREFSYDVLIKVCDFKGMP